MNKSRWITRSNRNVQGLYFTHIQILSMSKTHSTIEIFCRKIIKLLVGNYLDRTALVQSGANLKLPTGSLTQRYITDQSFLHSPSRLPIIRDMIVATCSSHGQASLSNVFSHCRSLTPLKRPRAARHRHAP